MDLGLKGKTAWVAGSSSGIGRAVAMALAREGADLALGSRDAAKRSGASNIIEAESGRRPFTYPLDLADRESVLAWADACREATGPAAILFCNSGGPPAGEHGDLDDSAWRAAADLLLHGAVTLSSAVLPDMKAAGWGRILFLTSVSVRQPIPGLMLSNSIRAAVQGYARSLANEVSGLGITVNCVAPGWTRTERLGELAVKQAAIKGIKPSEIEAAWIADIPVGRLADPAEIAAVAAFLAGEPAGYVTGQMITVDGGYARSLF